MKENCYSFKELITKYNWAESATHKSIKEQNIKERDENFAKLNQNYQKLIEKYGYDGLNAIFQAILAEKKVKNLSILTENS